MACISENITDSAEWKKLVKEIGLNETVRDYLENGRIRSLGEVMDSKVKFFAPDELRNFEDKLKSKLFTFIKGLNIEIEENANQMITANAMSGFDMLQKYLALSSNITQRDLTLQSAYIIYSFLGKKSKMSIELWKNINKWSKYQEIYDKYKGSKFANDDVSLEDLERYDYGEGRSKFKPFAHRQAIIHFIADMLEYGIDNEYIGEKDINPDISKAYFESLGFKNIYEKNIFINILNKIVNWIKENIYDIKPIRELNEENLKSLVLDIVDDVYKQDYTKWIREYRRDPDGVVRNNKKDVFEKKDYDRTINSDPYLKSILTKLFENPFVEFKLSGSQVIRKYGVLLRALSENLHDIDGVITLETFRKEKNSKEFYNWIQNRGLKLMRSKQHDKFFKEIQPFLEDQAWYTNVKDMFPSWTLQQAFIGRDHTAAGETVTITGYIEHPTEKEIDSESGLEVPKRYTVDFFLRTNEGNYPEIFDNYWKDWKQIFEAKINMGRGKDLNDLVFFEPYIKDKYKFTNKGFRYFTFSNDAIVSSENKAPVTEENKTSTLEENSDPMFYRDMPIETMEDFFEKYPNSLDESSQRLTRGNEIVSKLVDRLKISTGIDANVITLTDAYAMLSAAGKSYNGEAGFFFNGKAYIVADRATTEVVFHEFAHPIIRAIAKSNPELFKSLYDQLASTAEGEAIIERVKITHKELTFGTPEFMEEAMVTSLGKKADNINKNLQETNRFTKFIKDFLYAIKQLFRKGIFPGQRIKIENLDVNTTLDELAEMLVNGKFQINTQIVTQKDVVSFTRDFNKDLVNQLASIDQKRTRLIGAALYSMARKQKNLIAGSNYRDVAGITKDLMGRSDVAEIIATLRDYQNTGMVPGETPEQQEEFLNLHATALLNSILRLEGAAERVLQSFTAQVAVIENDASTPQEQQKALLSAFYTNRVTKEWIKFIQEAKDQLREAGIKNSHEIFRILNDINETLDRATIKSKKLYTAGVSAMLIEQLTPMKKNIEDHYKMVLQKLKDKGASPEVIKLYENEYDAVKLTDDKIKGYLLGELGDAHSLNVFLEGFAHAQDPILMGFSGYVKNRFVQMNAIMHEAYYGFINDIEPLVNKAGYNSAYSRMNMGKDMLYLDVVERDDAGVPTKMVWKYITPFKDYKGEYRKLKKAVENARKKVDQNNNDENNIELVLAMETLDTFEKAYMHRRYTPAFYEKSKFFTDDIGKEAERRRDRVLSKLRSLKSGVQSPDDIIKNTEDAKLAWREYKQLSDLFYEDGTPKDPESMDYKVAERLQEYKNYTKKFYDWVPLKGVFENAYINYTNSLKAKGLSPEDIELEQKRWLELNTVQKLSNKFYEERAKLFLELQRLAEEDPSQKEVSEIFSEITRLIAPYKDDNGEPEALTMPDHVVDRVIELENKLISMRDNVPPSVSKAMPSDTYDIYLQQLPDYNSYIAGDTTVYKGKTQEEIDSVLTFMAWATETLTAPYIERLRERFIKDNRRLPDSAEEAQINIEALKLNQNETKKKTVLRKLMDLQERVPTQDYIDMLNMFVQANDSLRAYLESEGIPPEGLSISDYKVFFNETIMSKVLSIDPAITYKNSKGDDVIITFSEWLEKNHFKREYPGKGGKIQVKYTPSRVWSKIAPKDPSYYKTTMLYDPITGQEIREIQGVPSLEYWTKVVQDEFVDDDGNIVKLKTKALTILDCIRQGIGIENATIDMHGDWLPRMDVQDNKFINMQFFDMKRNSPDKYNLLLGLLKQHLSIQETVPYDSRLDLEYERYRTSQYEIISNRSTQENIKENPISRFWRNLGQFFGKSADDFEMGFNPTDRENYIKADLFDDAYVKVPVTGMYELDPKMVTMDMLTSISRYQQSLIKQKTLIDMLPMAKVLHSLVQTPPNELKESAASKIKKEKFMNRVAASLTVPFGSKGSNFREIAIRGFIEREFEGKSLDGFFGNTPGVQKLADALLSISSTTFFAFNIPAALKNSMGAQWQALIQAAAGDNFNAKDFAIGNAWSAKVTSEITMEVYKFGNKSMNYQLVELMDPTQGRLAEGIREGKGISKSVAKDAISLKYATSVREWTQLQATLAIFGAMLNKKLLDYVDPKTGTAGKIKYSEAWEVVDGRLTLKKGVDESYAPGGKNYVAFVKRLHGVVNKANGAYDSFNQPLAARYLLYRMIMHLKKYFMELFMERFKYRWSTEHRMITPRYDGYTDSVSMGYYIEFLRAAKRFFTIYKMNFYNLTDTERQAASKVLAEGGMLLLFNVVLLGLLFGWDDDDENRFAKLRKKSDALPLPFTTDNPGRDFKLSGWLSNHLLNLTLQIEAENDSWIPLPGMGLNDYKEIALLNSAALAATFERWVDLVDSFAGMASGEVYQRSAGPYMFQEEGKYKFYNQLAKLLTFTGTTTEPIQAIETLDKRNK